MVPISFLPCSPSNPHFTSCVSLSPLAYFCLSLFMALSICLCVVVSLSLELFSPLHHPILLYLGDKSAVSGFSEPRLHAASTGSSAGPDLIMQSPIASPRSPRLDGLAGELARFLLVPARQTWTGCRRQVLLSGTCPCTISPSQVRPRWLSLAGMWLRVGSKCGKPQCQTCTQAGTHRHTEHTPDTDSHQTHR